MPRYAMDIEVTGNAEAKLDRIASGVTKLSNIASGSLSPALNDVAGSAEKMSNGFALDRISDKVTGFANDIAETTKKLVQMNADWVKGVISDAALFEDAQAEMRFAFGKDWEGVMEQVKKDAADLTFTFQETSQLAASMGRLHINPFGGALESQQTFISRTGQSIRALAVLQDTADSVGKSAQDVVIGVRNALSGSWKSLQDRFDIPKDKINAWKKSIEGLKEPQEKYNKLVSELALMYGGAGAEKAGNWNKNIAQIPDLIQQIKAGAGAEGLKIMTAAVQDLVKSLTSFSKSKEAMAALSDGFKVIGQGIAFVIRTGAAFVRWVQEIVTLAPWLPKLAVGFGVLTIAAMGFATVITGIGATIAAVIAGIMAIGVEVVAGVAVGMAVAAPVVIALTAALGALGLVAKLTSDIFGEKWAGSGGVFSIFEKGKLLFNAFGEILSSFNGTTATMSMETAENLKKAGLLEFVGKAYLFLVKMNGAWEEFSDTLNELGEIVGPVIVPMVSELAELITELADNFGILSSATKAGNGTLDDYKSTGRTMALVLGDIAHFTVQVIRFFTALARVVNFMLTPFFLVFKGVLDAIKATFEGIGTAIDFVGKKWDSIKGSLPGGGPGAAMRQDAEKAGWRKLFHEEAVVKKDPLRELGRASRAGTDFGMGDAFNNLGAKEKQAEIASLVDSGQLSAEDGERMMRGRPMRAKPRQGRAWDEQYMAAPTSVMSPDTPGPNRSVETPASSFGRSSSQASAPAAGGMSIEQFYSAVEKISSRPISVQIDRREIARAQNDEATGVSGGE